MGTYYINSAIDFADQLANLKKQGLVVSNDADALRHLRFTNKPQLPERLPLDWITNASKLKPYKLYVQLCYLAYMEQSVDPNCGFVDRLKALLAKYPMVDVAAMGFPKGWELEPLWR